MPAAAGSSARWAWPLAQPRTVDPAGEDEPVDLEGHVVAGERNRGWRDVEVQVCLGGVAGAAEESDDVAAVDFGTDLDRRRAEDYVRIEGKVAVADVDDHVVSAELPLDRVFPCAKNVVGGGDGKDCMASLLRRPRSRGLGKRAWLLTWSIRLILWTLGFTRIIRTEIVNDDVVPDKGAVILAANHTSMIDVFFILAALRREAIAMAMAELWKSPLTRWLVEVLGQIPVVRGDSDSGKEAMESAAHALEDGALVGIFPEGQCVKPGEVARYRPGVAVLAKDTGVPIIPVRLVNANEVLPLGKKFPRFGSTVYVIFGEPIDPDEFATVPELLDEVRRRITCLEVPQ
jgi:1-acyl-sn-glycerol-3-phosphate acyltransferase